MRGEYYGTHTRDFVTVGSPPHAWGIQYLPTAVSQLFTVHPHMRGEYASAQIALSLIRGSPPHAWGIHSKTWRKTNHTRFTPTCVGNTLILALSVLFSTVHPHMRGEYLYYNRKQKTFNGSPPHAWGILGNYIYSNVFNRFTPTCVGNTINSDNSSGFWPVHPHMRGEYVFFADIPENKDGSPPHAWGIHLLVSFATSHLRFTPTCVGNTSHISDIIKYLTVHPHMRGEYSKNMPNYCKKQ